MLEQNSSFLQRYLRLSLSRMKLFKRLQSIKCLHQFQEAKNQTELLLQTERTLAQAIDKVQFDQLTVIRFLARLYDFLEREGMLLRSTKFSKFFQTIQASSQKKSMKGLFLLLLKTRVRLLQKIFNSIAQKENFQKAGKLLTIQERQTFNSVEIFQDKALTRLYRAVSQKISNRLKCLQLDKTAFRQIYNPLISKQQNLELMVKTFMGFNRIQQLTIKRYLTSINSPRKKHSIRNYRTISQSMQQKPVLQSKGLRLPSSQISKRISKSALRQPMLINKKRSIYQPSPPKKEIKSQSIINTSLVLPIQFIFNKKQTTESQKKEFHRGFAKRRGNKPINQTGLEINGSEIKQERRFNRALMGLLQKSRFI